MRVFQYGLRVWQVEPAVAPTAHYHNDMEMLFLERGRLGYLYHGQLVKLAAGDVMLFWASVPHRVQQLLDDGTLHVLTIPLPVFLGWNLDAALVENLLQGQPQVQSPPANQVTRIRLHFEQWARDLHMASPERREIVLLELHALLRRLQLNQTPLLAPAEPGPIPSTADLHARRIAQYIAQHYRRPLTLDEIGAAVGLHPNYASTLFRRAFDCTVWEYLSQWRVAHAQRLLLMTDVAIQDIVADTGFTSVSQFYAVFRRYCGESPRKYRMLFRGPPSWGSGVPRG